MTVIISNAFSFPHICSRGVKKNQLRSERAIEADQSCTIIGREWLNLFMSWRSEIVDSLMVGELCSYSKRQLMCLISLSPGQWDGGIHKVHGIGCFRQNCEISTYISIKEWLLMCKIVSISSILKITIMLGPFFSSFYRIFIICNDLTRLICLNRKKKYLDWWLLHNQHSNWLIGLSGCEILECYNTYVELEIYLLSHRRDVIVWSINHIHQYHLKSLIISILMLCGRAP